MIILDPGIITAARDGSRAALEVFVRQIQMPVYNISRRMLANRDDAEEATQEVLILAVTRLARLQEPKAAGAWVLRIAMRYLIRKRRSSAVEKIRFTTKSFATDLQNGLESHVVTQYSDPDRELLGRQVKIGCTIALLTCLSRGLRAAYILGEIYELSDEAVADALGIAPATARQRLHRARGKIENFTKSYCGLVSEKAACHCLRRSRVALQQKRIGSVQDKTEAEGSISLDEVASAIDIIEHGRKAAALMRSNPAFISHNVFSLDDILKLDAR